MIIKLLVKAEDKKEANSGLDDIICVLQNNIKLIKMVQNEPYWKTDGIYQMEVKIDFIREITKEELNRFLYSITDKWELSGDPVNEAMSSETMDGQTYFPKEIKMIDILF